MPKLQTPTNLTAYDNGMGKYELLSLVATLHYCVRVMEFPRWRNAFSISVRLLSSGLGLSVDHASILEMASQSYLPQSLLSQPS